jgi:acetyl-CoA carboxylase biotin carboxylase subunit
MFKKVLIANRGEIAVRIAQTLQEMGIRAVAVYSEPDRRSVHVARADEANPLDGATSAETYLRGDKIIEIAKRHGADAIHPGYGFLAENAAFAEACRDAGITFIGPRPEAIQTLGDKTAAKRIAVGAGVPVVPGWTAALDASPKAFVPHARKLGFPVLIKAAAGGGGKGMRRVREETELGPAVEAARREAAASFGDSRVFIEKSIERPRHVEIQILGDEHGNVYHLFERECSIQRRHQKIIEETPSPALTPELRRQMGEAAVRLARAAGYTNAGTVEFLLDEGGAFYFLEVNTRLQVEHPVTEETLRLDLVKLQLLAAAGERLPLKQQEITQTAHAMECRVYAEDPARGFLPSVGVIERYQPPAGRFIRVDSGVTHGSEVSVHYDPMLAKLIVWGPDRAESIQRMIWALRRFVVLGVTTNIEFLLAVVSHPDFQAGRMHTHCLEDWTIAMDRGPRPPVEAVIAAALAGAAENQRATGLSGHPTTASMADSSPWRTAGPWRL